MPTKKNNGANEQIAGGGALVGLGAATAPVFHAGTKDRSKMVSASPKMQASRYQGELHNAMKTGAVDSDTPVRVFRTPSGRHMNAGGTHRHIARQAMGKPSNYEIKDIGSEVRVSGAQKLGGKMQINRLARASRRAEAGKVRPVNRVARNVNRVLSTAGDIADDNVWEHSSNIARQAKLGRAVGFAQASALAGAGGLAIHAGMKNKKNHLSKRMMSDTEIRRRKKLQGHISYTTGTLGLAGLSAFTAGRLGGEGKVALKAQKVIPKLKKINPKKADEVALGASTTAGGIGGLGAFNFGAYTNAESKKRNLVAKNDRRASAFGVIHD